MFFIGSKCKVYLVVVFVVYVMLILLDDFYVSLDCVFIQFVVVMFNVYVVDVDQVWVVVMYEMLEVVWLVGSIDLGD